MKKSLVLKKIISLWLPVLIWASIIFLFSSRPTVQASEIHWQDFFIKKSAHLVEYFIFSFLLFRAFMGSGVIKRKAAILSIFFIILYAFSDEFHQSFTPGREPRLRDVLIDISGGILAIVVLWKMLPYSPKKIRELVERLLYSY